MTTSASTPPCAVCVGPDGHSLAPDNGDAGPGSRPPAESPTLRAPRVNPPEPALDIYVGNLPYNATEDDVRNHFAPHAAVDSVRIVTDRETGRAKGFAFVTIDDATAARDAIRALDGQPMDDRALRVNEAQERRPPGHLRSRGRY